MLASQNGYTANDVSQTEVWTIPGTTRKVRLRSGPCGWLLVHFAAWFHDNIEPIDEGQLDDWGYAERTIRGDSVTLSNHASGTALDLNATRHPLGVPNTFTGPQAAAIRAQLATVYKGTIRGGLDYAGRKDEMHFEVVAPLTAVTAVVAGLKLRDGIRGVAVRVLPLVDLSNVRRQARLGGGDKPLPGVRRIQRALNANRPDRVQIEVDGHFGPTTKSAYRRWQNDLGLTGPAADGIPGRASLTKLGTKRFRVVS